MQLTRFAYYSDFVAYPIVIITLTVIDFSHLEHQPIGWLSSCAVGVAVWTLVEYALHRVALHRMPVFSPLHALHHRAPLEFIGTATWVSVPVWCATILVPLWALLGINIAMGITIGVMLGYWWYGIVHHIIHHRAHEKSVAYFKSLRAWHMRHHHSPKLGNFGVTTRMWDHVFGTAIDNRHKTLISS